MSAKITLTGYPTGPIEAFSDYFRFDMEEGGSAAPPKGLPGASALTFTVFVSKKAGKKLGFPDSPAHRLLIQGELTAELPMDQCPGELGVIAFKVDTLLPQETAETMDDDRPTTPAVATPAASVLEEWPDLSEYPSLPLSQVIIPEAFLLTPPNAKKTSALQIRIAQHGQLDEPIVVRATENKQYLLIDGYRRYLIAEQLGWVAIPVRIEEDTARRAESRDS
ncbi:MAG: hypothetical protein C7B43_04035 [Sulfobacillus benefaciens]|jgi:hypothetical protein|uniref:ParB-like N-terminal domain-containing protein n=1 Tax=Sulfobacillus benefaciens TaxID=453960 RepID=A0A2T2X9A6_9FIRM|nr:MAG: hypothetical protein C7B43_04035 [Sulfobacillus benefaciens]